MSNNKDKSPSKPKYEVALQKLVSQTQMSGEINNLSNFAARMNDALGIEKQYRSQFGFTSEQGFLIFKQHPKCANAFSYVVPILRAFDIPIGIQSIFYKDGDPKDNRFSAILVQPGKLESAEIERVPLKKTGKSGYVDPNTPKKRGRKANYEDETIPVGGLNKLVPQYGFFHCLSIDTAVDVTLKGETVYSLVSCELFSKHLTDKKIQRGLVKSKPPRSLSVLSPAEVTKGGKQISSKRLTQSLLLDEDHNNLAFGSLQHALGHLSSNDFEHPLVKSFGHAAAASLTQTSFEENIEVNIGGDLKQALITTNPGLIGKWKDADDFQDGKTIRKISDLTGFQQDFFDAVDDAHDSRVRTATVFQIYDGSGKTVEVMIAPQTPAQ